MATLAKNSVFENFRGKFGNQFVIRQSNGKTILSSLPGRSSKSSTAKQEAGRIKFQAATEFAKRIIQVPAYRELYAKRGNGKRTAYNMAVSDYFNPPAVVSVDCTGYHGNAGEMLRIVAIDDIQVKRVFVSLRDADNNELEFGDCELDNLGLAWNYYFKADHTPIEGQYLRVMAYDIPENEGEKMVII